MEFSLGSDYSSIEPLLNQAQEILIKHYPYEPKNQESDISPKKDFPNELFSQLIYDIEELLEAMLIVKRIQ